MLAALSLVPDAAPESHRVDETAANVEGASEPGAAGARFHVVAAKHEHHCSDSDDEQR